MRLIIATFNVKDYGNNNKEDKVRAKSIWSLVEKHKIDILSLQEITPSLIAELKEISNKHNYYVTEAFRMKNPNNKFNESNTIISRFPSSQIKVLWLSKQMEEIGSRSYRSLFPRNVNITEIVVEELGSVTFMNTHLDLPKYTRIRQLKCLQDIILKEKNDYLFLTGDFNTKTHRKYFINFIDNLKKIGLKHVDNDKLTCKDPFIPYFNGTIDHIFIPNNFKVITTKVIDTNISDHKIVISNIELIKNTNKKRS